MFTWSESPQKDMWENLNFLSKKENVRNLLSGHINSNRKVFYTDEEILEKKSSQISMCIRQAYEFYMAAENSSLKTSPLLFFYGMLSLSKALVIANNEGVYIENVKYHGLHTRPITTELNEYLKEESSWSIENQYAVSANGVFKLLCETLGYLEFPDESIFLFKDILSTSPELKNMYEIFYNEPSSVYKLYSHDDKKNILSTTSSRDTFEKVSCQLYEDFELLPDLMHGLALQYKLKENKDFPDYLGVYKSKIGGRYIVGGLHYKYNDLINKKYVDQVICQYIGMFILSINVRYKQEFWGNITSGQENGVISLIERFLSISKRIFPNIILDNLFSEPFEYGAPARYS
ncbi:YaaC family protein [Mycoplasmatota bacterium WC44]